MIGNKVAQRKVSHTRKTFLLKPIDFNHVSVLVWHHALIITKYIYNYGTGFFLMITD
jgi:hypothetical protein